MVVRVRARWYCGGCRWDGNASSHGGPGRVLLTPPGTWSGFPLWRRPTGRLQFVYEALATSSMGCAASHSARASRTNWAVEQPL